MTVLKKTARQLSFRIVTWLIENTSQPWAAVYWETDDGVHRLAAGAEDEEQSPHLLARLPKTLEPGAEVDRFTLVKLGKHLRIAFPDLMTANESLPSMADAGGVLEAINTCLSRIMHMEKATHHARRDAIEKEVNLNVTSAVGDLGAATQLFVKAATSLTNASHGVLLRLSSDLQVTETITTDNIAIDTSAVEFMPAGDELFVIVSEPGKLAQYPGGVLFCPSYEKRLVGADFS